MARNTGIGSLLIAGLAAYGIYRFSKLSQQDKQNLKEKGKKLFDENVPESVKTMFGKKEKQQTADVNSENAYL